MPHARQEIRDALVANLIAGATVAGSRVYASRYLPLRRNETPALAVYLNDEDIDADSWESAPVLYVREPEVVIQGWVEATVGEDIDDLLDDLALEVEDIVAADDNVAGIERIRLASTSKEVTTDGDRLMGVVLIRYVARYRQLAIETAPTLDDFETANVTHDVSRLDPDVSPEVDSVSVQE